MGSIVPFQDLNLSPFSPSRSATLAVKVPKIEPKVEPFDPSFETYQPQEHLYPSCSYQPFPASKDLTHSQSSTVSSEEDTVYSEFYHVSEFFRVVFADQLKQRCGDGAVLDRSSLAIVPVKDNDCVSPAAVPRRHPSKRSSELVRVTELGINDQLYFRDVVRRTRIVFNSLRIFSADEVSKRRQGDNLRRVRGDLLAASAMRHCSMWLNRDKRIVGSIPGIEIGDLFFFRMELCVLGLHGQTQAGIDYVPANQSTNGEPIATSIIVSGGYEDDVDAGDIIVYTGHGGQDKFSRQCMHQKLEGGNLALERSMHHGIEVRVIRGLKHERGATNKLYVYDGLYQILDCWFDVGKSGFGVYKYKLIRIEGQPEMGSSILRLAQSLKNSPLSVRPKGYLSLDISRKKENVPVLLFNEFDGDHDPLCHDYLVRTVFPPYVFSQRPNGNGCACVSDCMDGCFCSIKNGGDFAYDHNGLLCRGKPLIFECGPFCSCPLSCRNRVSQRGSRNTLEVFRSRETGWGVRSLDLIHAGSFICEYAGVALTKEQVQVFTMNGDTLIYPERFAKQCAEWGDFSQIYHNYKPPSYPSLPPLDFALDVSRMRNVACYISHCVTPNVLVQFVLFDHNNLMFPHLMLFALENIPPLRQLSLDYGVADDEWTGKLPICNGT